MARSQPRRSRRPSTPDPRTRVAALRALEQLENRVLFATFTWDGSAGDGLWSNGANWDLNSAPNAAVDLVVFPSGPTSQNTTQDIPGLSIARVSFNGGGYTVAGANGLTLADDIRGNNTSGTNTV